MSLASNDGFGRGPGNSHGAEGLQGALDDGYWESLLRDGEVVSSNDPPPWVEESFQFTGNHFEGNDRVDAEQEWQRALDCLENAKCCHLPATGFNRGGLLVQFGCLTGFVPSSHLLDFPSYADPLEREHGLMGRVGEEIKLRVIEIDRARNRLILSQRAALEGEHLDELFERLRPGDVVSGRVSNLRRFGAFVDLGGFEGLIHISELSWGRVNHPGDVVQPGDKVKVYIMAINPEERKIQLSLKRLHGDPWQVVAEQYAPGDLVSGEITNVVSFGAFVRLHEGIEGLIHISELAEGNFLHPRNVVSEGDWVEARVLNVDPARRRIGLSLRQSHQKPEPFSRRRASAERMEPVATAMW